MSRALSVLSIVALVATVLVGTSTAYAKNDDNNGNGRTVQSYGHENDDHGNQNDDHGNAYGYGGSKVDVCRVTGSRFFPYVKVTVPYETAETWLHSTNPHGVKAVKPDADGNCPPPDETIGEYIHNLLASVFSKIHFPHFG